MRILDQEDQLPTAFSMAPLRSSDSLDLARWLWISLLLLALARFSSGSHWHNTWLLLAHWHSLAYRHGSGSY
ncbi:hypothetical protein BKA91DRAFT_142787 [Yarrowia lipolytica]|nr:hypothetical protein BKA91DRAFT_142787 [Yarrowia lipolytica]